MDVADGRAIPNMAAFSDMIYGDIKLKMQSSVFKIQEDFCEEIQKLEEYKTFITNKWKRGEAGEGITQILEDGDIFEKVGVCASKVTGTLPSSAYSFLTKRSDNCDVSSDVPYFSTGISGVVYPKNPHIPTLNFNYRYFEINDGIDGIWWFGGGSDLTPCILNKDDCQHFHMVLKQCCGYYYDAFKKNCDDHFYLRHRGERRGIGGIFFDKLNFPDQNKCFHFVAACMQNIIPSYMPIVQRNMEKSYRSEDREWQLTQRGRYVEFSLICDKATKLVLMTPGVEYENILMCLPPSAKWHYNSIPKENSKEYELVNILRNPIDWV